MGYTSPSFLPIAASPAPSVARSGCSADAAVERCCGPMGDGMTRPGSGPRSGRTEARSVVSAALRFHGFVLRPRSSLRPLFPKRQTPDAQGRLGSGALAVELRLLDSLVVFHGQHGRRTDGRRTYALTRWSPLASGQRRPAAATAAALFAIT